MFTIFSKTKNNSEGFSLIELLISVSIVSIVSVVIIVNQVRFNSSLLLQNLAYDVALSIRQAQAYGLSVRSVGGSFTEGYGIHVNATNPSSYIFFADDGNNRYESGVDEILEAFTLQQGNTVGRFCVTPSSGVPKCSDTAAVTQINIVFRRPDPDATITSNIVTEQYQSADLYLTAPDNNAFIINVSSTGQISISTD